VSKSSAVVVIPTFNEAANIARLIPQLLELNVDLLVVDDSSTDGTPEVVSEFAEQSERVHILSRPGKMGLGSAYRESFARLIKVNYQLIIQMDADGSHRVADLRQMMEFQKDHPECDLVIGSRWTAGGALENWPKKRELLSRVANFYSRTLLGLKVKDNTAGFRIYRSELLKKIKLSEVTSEGYAFQIEMTRAAKKAGANFAEVPILFVEREFGTSKMSGKIIREALIKVTKWGILRIIGR
jgi:dolichol-phosphate mannosyltransferase